jgi:predicted AlkP superfamily pyrophosphatase or phosphodiesterase
VAFDGLDHDLIKRYNCETLLSLTDFGRIDNHSPVSSIKTSELFASFITGKPSSEHGITGLRVLRPKYLETFENLVHGRWPFSRFTELRNAVYRSVNRVTYRKPLKQDLQCRTLFDQIPDSKALYVPSYNPAWFWFHGTACKSLNHGTSLKEVRKLVHDHHRTRRRNFFQSLNKGTHQFCMVHFHLVDYLQHFYGCDNSTVPELEDVYLSMDQLAAKILDRSDYDEMIFMSDHGLPDGPEHNRNAFYASTVNLFEETTPPITAFYPKIRAAVDAETTPERMLEQVGEDWNGGGR